MIFICLKPQYKIVIWRDAPRRGGTSGGSLRSSRQAVACHPFTRSWATMPPEVPPRRGFSATWTLMMVISIICSSPCVLKRIIRTSWWKMNSVCVKKRFNAHASLGITFEKPGRGRRVKPALAPEKRRPAQWVGPAEFSVPTRGFCCHVLNS